MAQKKLDITKILLPVVVLGAAYFIYKGMQTSADNRSGGESSSSTKGGGWKLNLPDLKPNDPRLKEACDLSYSLIGANRYLCYQKLKQPKEDYLYLLESTGTGANNDT
jgi:hypothetical protein